MFSSCLFSFSSLITVKTRHRLILYIPPGDISYWCFFCNRNSGTLHLPGPGYREVKLIPAPKFGLSSQRRVFVACKQCLLVHTDADRRRHRMRQRSLRPWSPAPHAPSPPPSSRARTISRKSRPTCQLYFAEHST